MFAAPPVRLRDVIRVCTDPNTAFIIDNLLNVLCCVSRMPSGCVSDHSCIICLLWSFS